MTDLLTLSATDLARRIRQRDLTSVQAVQAHVDRIRAVNGALNAMVAERFDAALEEAREADALQAKGTDLPPLHGVPCSIKECFAVTGMPQTAGLLARKDYRSPSDATAVARLRAAGAIPLGVTNTSELCMWMESSNRVYGTTSNPYDRARIVGGSSGGEAALVAAGGVPFGLGSDIGGSIRMPAFFCGVFGHKPTGGLVPGTGQFPMAHGDGRTMLSTGPISRRAEDLYPLLKILAGPDGQDLCHDLPLQDPAQVDVGDLTVLVVEGNGLLRVSADLKASLHRAADVLKARGAKVRTVKMPQFRRSLELWSGRMSAAATHPFQTLLGEGTPIPLGREFLRWSRRQSAHTFPALALALLEKIPFVTPKDPLPVLHAARAMRDDLSGQLGERGVLLFPPYTRTAPRHGWPMARPIDWLYTALFNALELPVTQVPTGLDARGLPLGVQVVGAHGQDHVTLAVAQALEQGLGGWVWPRV